jgi:hypothetical protein
VVAVIRGRLSSTQKGVILRSQLPRLMKLQTDRVATGGAEAPKFCDSEILLELQDDEMLFLDEVPKNTFHASDCA